ncbi:transcriptional regulator BetI [Phenylobacterium montanum]|uniref:Transcriptional regulator BetI n=1 Tax=Phenylobacterium montanum TaxID=2823693 RepID=A0A975IVF4_9CAUL|nr:transcriptional regulator BetI [Caulobacter sp. S6]QUD88788.1 transcriptional regulator BetI [Caulobacter sp. S6]
MSRAPFIRASADVRRQDLITATARLLAERGVAGTSVRTICAAAGVSPGLLRHYFEGVDDLIAATYDDVGVRISSALDEAVEAAGPNPRARLRAYLTASFRPPILDPAVLATWLAFWSLVRLQPEIGRLHGEIYAQYRARLEALLLDCAGSSPTFDIRLAAIGLCAAIDGLWLELCLDPTTFTPDEAGQIAERFMRAWLEE